MLIGTKVSTKRSSINSEDSKIDCTHLEFFTIIELHERYPRYRQTASFGKELNYLLKEKKKNLT